MSDDAVDKGKRRFLVQMTSIVGGAGAVGLAVPFVRSMSPSARAEAAGAPVAVDISKLQPGEMVIVEWRKKPVWIVNRTDQNLSDLPKLDGKLADPASEGSRQPEYAKNEYRASDKHKNILVVEGICTHLGCSPKYRPEMAPADLGDDWIGGFFCPCHGSRFDLAGRVFSGVPAPTNLPVPPYRYVNATTVLVGENPEGAA
jgi:ubiquinol-cytochrome c reductase iron-sulfur subunit